MTRYFPPIEQEEQLYQELEQRRERMREFANRAIAEDRGAQLRVLAAEQQLLREQQARQVRGADVSPDMRAELHPTYGGGSHVNQAANPRLAMDVAELHELLPHIPNGAILAAAQMGLTPDSEEVETLSRLSAQHEISNGMGFRERGEVVRAEQLQHEAAQEKERSPWTKPLRAVTRGLFTAFQTPIEEVSRSVSAAGVASQDPDLDYAEARELGTPSIGSLAADRVAEGEDSGLGEGWLPGGEVREEQERLKKRLTLDGEWVSPGRLVARKAVEPGTRQFNLLSGAVDAAFNIFGDPATIATLGASKVNTARRGFHSTQELFPLLSRVGLIPGTRRTTAQEVAEHWASTSREAGRLWEHLAKERDPYKVWTTLRKRADRHTVLEITEANTAGEVLEAVLPKLGTNIRERPVGTMLGRGMGMMTGSQRAAAAGIGVSVRSATDNVRLLQWTPHRSVSAQRMEQSIEDLDRFMKGVKLPAELRAQRIGEAMRVGDGDTVGLLNVTKRVMADTVGELTGRGVSDVDARKLTRLFDDTYRDLQAFYVSDIGEAAIHPLVKQADHIMDGDKVVKAPHTPHLVSELINREIPLPDMRELRRQVSALAPVLRATHTDKIFHVGTDVLSNVMSKVWKPLQLIRGAYVARVVGEEQLRMAAAGYDSAIKHPISYIAWLSSRKGDQTLSGLKFKDLDEHIDNMQRMGGGWLDNLTPGVVPTGRFTTYGPDAPLDLRMQGWQTEVAHLANDPIAVRVANGGPLPGDGFPTTELHGTDAIVDWLTNGTGTKFLRELENVNPDIGNAANIRTYVDSVWERIVSKTGGSLKDSRAGNPELIQAIATGRIGGKRITGGEGSKALRETLTEYQAWLPQFVKGEIAATTNDRKVWDRAVGFLGDMIMSKPTNYASRSPVFRQAFYKRAEELMPFATKEVQDAAVAGARKAGLGKKELAQLKSAAGRKAGDRIETLEQLDTLAGAHAFTETRKLLYDLTERGQISDIARVAAPFMEAWKEIGVAWGRLVRQRPHTVRRAQQVIEGARGADPDGDGRGFFYSDPVTGEEMFAYPGKGLLSRFLFDQESTEVAMTGSVQGLNLFAGSVIPGLGPVVQVPLSYIVPDKPGTEWLRENFLFPFGEPPGEEPVERVTNAMLPAWFNKLQTWAQSDPESDRVFANSQFDVMRAMVASGDYSTHSQEDIDRLLDDARPKARLMWFIRGLAQFTLPTGPQFRFSTKDLEGESWMYAIASQAYHDKAREEGQEHAQEWFLRTFGVNNHLLTQGKSREVLPHSVTKAGTDWEKENPQVREAFPLTGALFAPEDPLGEFDYDAYLRAFKEGDREQLTPEQMVWLSNNTLGRVAYESAKNDLGTGEWSRMILQIYKAQLQDEFPGFDTFLGVTPRPRLEDQMKELDRIVESKALHHTPAGQGLELYYQARAEAQSIIDSGQIKGANNQPLKSYKQADAAEPIRTWLRDTAMSIGQQHPDFLVLWDRILQRELKEDDDPVQGDELLGRGRQTTTLTPEVS